MWHVEKGDCQLKLFEEVASNKKHKIKGDLKTLTGRNFEGEKIMRLSKEINIFEELQRMVVK